MSMEKQEIHVNLKDYFDKINPEDSAVITRMCLEQLTVKANELKDLYVQLSKTYGIEMGICGITLLVQISSPSLPFIPIKGLFGTSEGIEHALSVMLKEGLTNLANMNKEEAND